MVFSQVGSTCSAGTWQDRLCSTFLEYMDTVSSSLDYDPSVDEEVSAWCNQGDLGLLVVGRWSVFGTNTSPFSPTVSPSILGPRQSLEPNVTHCPRERGL